MPRISRGGPVSQWAQSDFGAYLPDVPALVNPGMVYARNIMPKANGFYGPARSPASVSSNNVGLIGSPKRMAGTIHSYKDPDPGTTFFYAGTASDNTNGARLLRYSEATGVWTNCSAAGGYTINVRKNWRFANLKDSVIAAGGDGTALQYLVNGRFGNFARLATEAPNAIDIAVVNPGFLVAVNVRDNAYGAGRQPYRVWWAAIGDPTNWPEPGTVAAINVQSDFQDLFAGGKLQRIFPGIGGNDAVIVGERHIWRMNYVGPPAIFDFRVAEYDQGITVEGAAAALNETLFTYGNGGFQMFDGNNSTPIGRGQVDEFFLNDVDFAVANGNAFAMCAGVDAENHRVLFAYRNEEAATEFNNRVLAYNIVSQRWGIADVAIDAMGLVDNQASATDSPFLVTMNQDFTTQRLTGKTLEAELDTKETSDKGGGETLVKSARPLIDAPDLYASLLTRDRQSQILVSSEEQGLEDDGTIPFDLDASRYYRARCRVPFGVEWSDAMGCEFETTPWAHGNARTG